MARRIRTAAARGNLYITTLGGVLKSTSASADLLPAGLPRCLDLVLSLSSAGTPVLLTDTGSSPTAGANQARGYRGVWCLRDANNNLIQGAPSARFFIVNTAGATRDVSVLVPIPPEITTSHFFQLYATSVIDFGDSIDVGDEMRLVNEYFPTSTDITNGTLTIVDIVPNAFRGADLYTNETQDGQAAQNDRPPLARDLVWFNNRLVASNTTDLHRVTLQMVGTVIAAADTITIGGVVFTAGAAEDTATGTFQVFKGGGGGFTDKGTQGLNVEYTAKSLAYIANRYAANTGFWAYYESGTDDAPGRILIEERSVGGSTITVTCSATAVGANFSPILPTTGSTYASVADRRVNQLRVSKVGEPEHMPLARNIIVGGEDEEIQRILPLNGSLIVIKDRSIWRLTEAEPGEAPILIDNTCGISGRDSAAVLNNAVFMLSDQGFVRVTENGIQIIGRPIEDKVIAGLEAISAPDHDRFVGIGVERDRYYICTAYDAEDSEITCYRYSPISNQGQGAWTRRRLHANAFAVNDNRLYYALRNAYGHVLQQRRARRDGDPWHRDYVEEGGTFVISSIDSTANTITGTFTASVNFDGYESSDIGYGWKLYKGNNQHLVLSMASSNTVLTLNSVSGLSVSDSLTIYRPIAWTVEYAPLTMGNPLEAKQWDAVLLKAETNNAYALDFSYRNEMEGKDDPADDDYATTGLPAADRVYVKTPTTADEPSASNNDFESALGLVAKPCNTIRTQVHPERAWGTQLAVRIAGGVAEGFVAIKALVVTAEAKQSNKVRQ
jgi:hypothetical protein